MSTVHAGARGRAPAGPSLRPALVVVALAALIVVGGAVLAVVGTPSARESAPNEVSSRVRGTPLRSEPAAPFLAHIASAGEPPEDVVGSLAVPAGATYRSRASNDRGVGQFDRSVTLSVAAPEKEVARFFRLVLSDEHWVSTSITSNGSRSELLAERNGSDGYQWEVGVILRAVHTIVSPALAGSGSSPATTTVTIQLYQVGDAS
ncbi:MAG TPA: hypothetical protein VKU92_06005 [Acidimicrobiales bacterium]|nr:hypothetical protein [Acidimicrobiales bacterium]